MCSLEVMAAQLLQYTKTAHLHITQAAHSLCYVGREQLRQKAEDAAAKEQQEARDRLKQAHAISAEHRAQAAAAHAKAKAA